AHGHGHQSSRVQARLPIVAGTATFLTNPPLPVNQGGGGTTATTAAQAATSAPAPPSGFVVTATRAQAKAPSVAVPTNAPAQVNTVALDLVLGVAAPLAPVKKKVTAAVVDLLFQSPGGEGSFAA